MNANCFRQLLIELNYEVAAQHSVINHHVAGLDYLCLHRDPKLTVKLYFIDPNVMHEQVPGTYLVTPHTHRYAFESTVLHGQLIHARFGEVYGKQYDRFEYSPETRTKTDIGESGLKCIALELHGIGSSYWCGTDDIHTLVMPHAPVLLGLVQFGDVVPQSTVYLRKNSKMDYPESRKPNMDEMRSMRYRALEMIGRQP